jgi:hypothetical protein
LEESVLEVDDLSVLELDNGSDDDDKSEGEGLSSGEEGGLGEGGLREGGLGEAPGEFGDIADCVVGVNIDFGNAEIQSSDESS